jgi:hypothetical protein
MTFSGSAFSTSDKSAIWIFGIAFCLRAAVFLTATATYHIPLNSFASKGDGASYLACAKAILGDSSTLTDYDRRVFPGYPALIALVHLIGFSFPLAALSIDWLSTGLAAAFARVLFGDRRVAWAMLFLLPHYLANSTLAMSEAPLLALTLAALLLAVRGHAISSGILLALAIFIRPMACFAAAGVAASLLVDRRYRQLITTALSAIVIVMIGVLTWHYFTGDALRGIRIYRDSPRAYTGQIFEWPFHALLTVPGREHVPWGFVTYIYVHVLVVLIGCAMIARRVLRGGQTRTLDCIALVWLLGNTMFQLCIGSTWGFRHFARFAIPSQPALFWALHPVLPRAKWVWWAAGCGVFVLAVVSVHLTP